MRIAKTWGVDSSPRSGEVTMILTTVFSEEFNRDLYDDERKDPFVISNHKSPS